MEILTCDNGIRIYPLDSEDKILEAFFCKMTANYGLTGSGKTYVTDTILEALDKCIPKFLCYSATEAANQNYSRICPASCVFKTFDYKKFEADVMYQEKPAGIWKQANDIKVLAPLANKVANSEEKMKISNYIKQLDSIVDDNTSDKEKKKIEAAKAELYKTIIRKYDFKDENDANIKKWLYLNPCMCIIIDDFAAQISEASKSKTLGQTFLRSLSMNSRHYMLTTMIMLQDTDAMDAKMRRNVQTNIFTSPSEARSFFNNKTNSFSPEMKKDVEYVIKRVWKDQDYKVLIYCRDNTSAHVWNYMIGSKTAKPSLGSKPLQILGSKITKNNVENISQLVNDLK